MQVSKSVKVWLFIGVVMLFVQVILGGITRITGSGLSITKWDIIIGSIPPLDKNSWLEVFELYKETPQYKKINGGMSLSDFKFIFFWEFIHRFWARIMGLVFLFPFIYFIITNKLNKRLLIRLSIVFVLAAVTASFGWIMVASGLLERPWVNAYKLSLHLILAFITYAYLLQTFFITVSVKDEYVVSRKVQRKIRVLYYVIWIQLFFGGLVSGMKAGLYYNTWPSMGGNYLPSILLDIKQWTITNMTLYDSNLFAPSLIQFIHRNIAYFIFFLSLFISIKLYKICKGLKLVSISFFSIIILQVLLGISVVLFTHGSIPLFLGVLHQAFAFFILGINIYLFHKVYYRCE